jgi:hypothetical protein
MISKLLKQIRQKRQRARRAGLEIISTEKLALIALASPHWREIGQGRGKFHFCRRDHSAGYTEENTFIGKSDDNVKERNERYKPRRKYQQPTERERAAARQRAWAKENPTKVSAKNRANRAKRKAVAAGNCNGSRNPT